MTTAAIPASVIQDPGTRASLPPGQLIDAVLGRSPMASFTVSELQAIDAASAFHGTDGLIWQRLREQGATEFQGTASIARRARLRQQWELAHATVLAELLQSFASSDLPVLILKGTALAYALYPSPSQRARGDSDLLIAAADLESAKELLAKADFKPSADDASGATQLGFERVDSGGARHVIDLHWSVINSPLLDRVWSFEELSARSTALPSLSSSARGLGNVDALLHACLHWAINRNVPYRLEQSSKIGGDRLIWLYDIHLLAQSLEADAQALNDLASQLQRKKLVSICLPALLSANNALPSAALDKLIQTFQHDARPDWRAWALRGGWLRVAIGELIALRSPIRQWHYVSDRLFATNEALQQRYPNDPRPTAVLQLQRWIDGLRKRHKRSR